MPRKCGEKKKSESVSCSVMSDVFGFSVHGISQARTMNCAVITF